MKHLGIEGRAALPLFALDPDVLHLNHGSFGAAPRSVLAELDRLRAHMEANLTRFFSMELPDLLRARAREVASRFGGDPDGWVFVENATTAANSVLDSLKLGSGDVIVTTSHAYGAVLKAMKRRAAEAGATVRVAELPQIVEDKDQIVAPIVAALDKRVKLLVLDHITSPTAIIFPVERLVEQARRRNIPVFIDGAHVPGQLPLDVTGIGADWYTGNAHKWYFAPKGCGLLWTAPARRAETHPGVTSHGYGAGYTREFDWTGTRDPTAWLCFPAAAQAHDGFGGEALMSRNMALAKDAGQMLSHYFQATVSGVPDMQCAMTSLRLRPRGTLEEALKLRRSLSTDHHIEVVISAFADALWLRISANIYNEMADYEKLAPVLKRLLTD